SLAGSARYPNISGSERSTSCVRSSIMPAPVAVLTAAVPAETVPADRACWSTVACSIAGPGTPCLPGHRTSGNNVLGPAVLHSGRSLSDLGVTLLWPAPGARVANVRLMIETNQMERKRTRSGGGVGAVSTMYEADGQHAGDDAAVAEARLAAL